ncbi:hypothetical protein G647_07393 [Cladophialophora carrionii CBS 160.54]|uniref:Cupin type-2 domain-containing protein n=1 Tax=Cladophialophora carrionii CBS 160.54 TaxID=1279043 RepID=V9D2E9_9EURO|nr:uncharacterized protein G647_07393 [Cladophialophora carrionii CBS 160.54]ETI21050.1 hypothetical protein G647_07393 [Cladophialophora carrionii CBS 160.54]
MTQPTTGVQGLPHFARHITTHNAEGIAIFQTSDPANSTPSNSSGPGSLPLEPSWFNFPTSAFGLGYATDDMPPDFNGNADLATYNKYQEQHPGVVIKGGTVFRVVDMAPGAESPMHRTVSIDYGVILEGEIELELDSGEKRVLKRGDLFVQRGTMHKWKNPSESQPARLVVVQLESKEVEVEGKGALKEEFRS